MATKKKTIKRKVTKKKTAMSSEKTMKRDMQKKSMSTQKVLTIIGLAVNVLFWPGLGTLIGGNTKKGIIQMILFVLGAVLSLVIIGIPIAIAIWIWALVSSIQQIKRVA